MTDKVLDPWQYRLSRKIARAAHRFGDWGLETGPGLPVLPISDASGRSVGALIGFPIDLAARRLISGPWQSSVFLTTSFEAFAKEVLWALGGRFLWIAETPGGQRIYPDCSAQVTCVYDPASGMVGSTAFALLGTTEYEARFDRTLFDQLEVDGEGWFPAGLTAHQGLLRLLPNHYLDLGSFHAHRFWPEAEVGTDPDPDAVVTEIIEIVQAQIEALTRAPKRLGMALTGGHETRMLLACARPYLDMVDMVTVVGGDRHEVDSVLARRIAADKGLKHIELPRCIANADQRSLFIRRGGHCNADSNSFYHPSVWPISETHNLVGGVGGEVARAFFWRDEDRENTSLTPSSLTARFGLVQETALSDALDRWLRDLPSMSSFEIMDLAYLEHRDGAWYAAQFCCDPTLMRFAPLLTARMVELMLRLPPDWKRQNRLGHAVIGRLWPELAAYPYNSLGPWRDALVKLQRLVANPALVVKKLRKLRS